MVQGNLWETDRPARGPRQWVIASLRKLDETQVGGLQSGWEALPGLLCGGTPAPRPPRNKCPAGGIILSRNETMKILSPIVHGVLDYIVVLAFAFAPAVVGFSGVPATISHLLAIVHLGLTLATAFPLGLWKLVPLRVHGAIELVVSVVLVVLPWIIGFSADQRACAFFVGAGMAIFLTWLLSDYAAP